MTLYHAWVPNADGSRPMGTIRQIVRSGLRTDRGAINWARCALGPSVRVEAYRDSIHFYADENGRKVI